jgi:dTDP-4-amino-4,6-dideoxygalactose transaminase
VRQRPLRRPGHPFVPPVKHIAAGEGGMVTTIDERLYKRLQLLRTHGITKDADLLSANHGGWYYEMVDLGYNYRLTDMQAALATSQLARAEAGVQRRRELAARYTAAFADAPIKKIRHARPC